MQPADLYDVGCLPFDIYKVYCDSFTLNKDKELFEKTEP
jgi:hypothetical protein